MASVARPRTSMRFRGRSYMAFALMPEAPVADWFAEIDEVIRNSAGFFVGRPVVLDLAAVTLSSAGVAYLVAELEARDIRVMGIENADRCKLGAGFPPVLKGGRSISPIEPRERSAPEARSAEPPLAPEQSSLLLDTSVRSGQSVIFPAGDVTVLGSIASGAEVVAGGSIHVYGALRGRAMAGSAGNDRARIFCGKLEAELLAIDGYYRTAEDLDPGLHGRPAQAWLDEKAMMVSTLD